MRSDDKYLEISHLSKIYPTPTGGEAVIVRDFNLHISKGEFVSLIGHSGCGKSTVLSIAAGLLAPTEGGVLIDDREIPGPGPDRGVVFQSPCLLPWMTAFDNVMLGVAAVKPEAPRVEREAIVASYLQRVGLARAFAIDPKVLLLDEPFGMLDSLTRFELQQVLVDTWAADRKTALMVTHDVDEALFLSDRIALMTNGPAAKLGGIVEVPFPRPRDRAAVLEHPDYYTFRERLIGFLEEQEAAKAA
jgi:nitrate/nitrite transport system ATP-binding protein